MRTLTVVAWGVWSIWSSCSATCGGGTSDRSRECLNGDAGDEGCAGDLVEAVVCGEDACPVAPVVFTWNAWTAFGACSVTCGGGTKVRTRTCDVADQCPGEASDFELCRTGTCRKYSITSLLND